MSSLTTLNLDSHASSPVDSRERTISRIRLVLSLVQVNHAAFEECGFGPDCKPVRELREKLAKLTAVGDGSGNLTVKSSPGNARIATVPCGTTVIGSSLVFGEKRDIVHPVRG